MKAGNLTIEWLYSIPEKRVTQCILNNDAHVWSGVAICAKGDHVCKETGRKVSLAKALKEAKFPKEERKVIWEAYRNTKQGGRW
jgi:hypothetical protein